MRNLGCYEFFGVELLRWHKDVERGMPWKSTKDPYRIWLSEIILQQTRVAQGKDYYERFVSTFPTIQDLAEAQEDEVLALWKGLGYYTRARNLHKAAQVVMTMHEGIFPNRHKDILALPGVGPYTAAAIASFAFGQSHAVVDGNVYRVLSRYFGETTPIDITIAAKIYNTLAVAALAKHDPALYNQAIMDFGAIQCTPLRPNCEQCPLQSQCIAFNKKLVATLPTRVKTKTIKDRFFSYFLIEYKHSIAIQKRSAKDIWKGLYELPLIEHNVAISDTKELSSLFTQNFGASVQLAFLCSSNQLLSHQRIHASFYQVKGAIPQEFTFYTQQEIAQKGFPKTVDDFLNNYIVYRP